MDSKRVVIAMSGGVDSAVAALLLRQQGFEPIGLFMRNGVEAPAKSCSNKTCCSVYDAKDARVVCAQLGIPFHSMDLSSEFGQLIQYFTDEYVAGRTPNPCAVCNRELKFGRLFDFTRELGAQWLATGHYARLEGEGENVRLRRAVDRKKDQSYQLFDIPRSTLSHVRFPLGGMHKEDVRAMARQAGMPVSEKAESQEICFVPSNDYRDLLRERAVESRAGEIVDVAGKTLGKHEGIAQFTIGQRRGLGIAAGEPRYVRELNPETGAVVIGSREDCLFRGARVSRLNWIDEAPKIGESRRLIAQIRYRHPGRSGELRRVEEKRVEFIFDEPELAVTPGQAAVFYDGEYVVGGGWIESSLQ